MVTMQVRCCCNPNLILGRIEWPVKPTVGQQVRFSTSGKPTDCINPDRLAGLEHVYLEVGTLVEPNGFSYLAVKSNDVPIETLRKIGQFSE